MRPSAKLILLAGFLGASALAQEEPKMPFRREATYTGAAGDELGGKWIHEATGFELRLLRIESVPQAFIHVTSLAPGDKGEPHTGEHLLLGKGTKGKALAAAQEMSLVESTAYTGNTEVCYSLNCAAGAETFLRSLETTLDALLFPDYTDAEIRGEVRHLAAVEVTPGGELRLEEKGTVYNEMVSTYEKKWVVFYELYKRLYGRGNPYGNVAGGSPEGIRALTPAEVHAFHAAHYHLANMGMIVSLPPSLPAEKFLPRLDAMLRRFAANPSHRARPNKPSVMPEPRPERDRSILRVPFPSASDKEAGNMVLAWSPRPLGTPADSILRMAFLEAFGDGEASWLHKLLIDTQSRVLEVPATSVWAGTDDKPVSEAPMIGFEGYLASGADETKLRAIERAVRAELDRLAALPAGDPELAKFRQRIETRLVETERGWKRSLSSPPLFGYRGGGGWWLSHLRAVDRGGGARRDLLLGQSLAEVRKRLDAEGNPWGAVIDDLGLRDAPRIGLSFASPAERERLDAERKARLERELAQLLEAEKTADEQTALRALRARLEAEEKQVAARDAAIPTPKLVDDVPRTFDDDLDWKPIELGGLPGLRARFESMTAVEVALYLPLEGVAEDELALLPLLPSLLRGAGLRAADGTRLRYDELQERLEREIGGISLSFDLRPETDRHELCLIASGADLAETRKALSWLERCVTEVDLDPENLPRLREVVRKRARQLRDALGRSEEGWVRNPAGAIRWQRDHLYLSTSSIHAQLWHLVRLRWLLTEPPAPEEVAATKDFLALVAELLRDGGADALAPVPAALEALGSGKPPEGRLARLAGLGGSQASLLRARDLVESLAELGKDVPPGRPEEWASIVAALEKDLAVGPTATLARLRRAWDLVLPRTGSRWVLTGKGSSLEALAPDLTGLVDRLRRRLEGAAPRKEDTGLSRRTPVVFDRVAARRADPQGPAPAHLALVNETSSSGVFVLGADVAPPLSADPERLIDLLAGSIDSGAGPHAFFMRTWAAGLAYSNGLRGTPTWGRISYYAERCPDLVETMRFVTGLAKDTSRSEPAELLEYGLAQLVSEHRASDRFEDRARAQATDLLDGLTPEKVAAQRKALLALRGRPGIWEEVRKRHQAIDGRVLVGLGTKAREQPGQVHFVIGPEKLLARWEEYVKEQEGSAETVHRIWPADFWVR